MKNRFLAFFWTLLILAGLLLAGCSSQSSVKNDDSSQGGYTPAEPVTEEVESATANLPSENPASDRKMIYTATMSFRCDDPGDALDQFAAKAIELGGYVSASWSNVGDNDRIERAAITLRLPAGTLDAFKDFAEKLGVVRTYNMTGNDVTDDYYDLDARLTQAKAREAQVLSFMSQAQTIEDTLAVYKELSSIREEIDVMEGRKRLWDNQVSYSTLTIDITANPTYVDDSPEYIRVITMSETWQRTRRGFINVARGTANFFSIFIILIGWLLIPAVIITAVVLLVVWLSRRSRRGRPSVPKPPAPPLPNA